MNQHELPKLFDAVLDGSCPLGIFADAVADCGFSHLETFLRRLMVVTDYHGSFAVGMQGRPDQYHVISTYEGILAETQAEAEERLKRLAVTVVRNQLESDRRRHELKHDARPGLVSQEGKRRAFSF